MRHIAVAITFKCSSVVRKRVIFKNENVCVFIGILCIIILSQLSLDIAFRPVQRIFFFFGN